MRFNNILQIEYYPSGKRQFRASSTLETERERERERKRDRERETERERQSERQRERQREREREREREQTDRQTDRERERDRGMPDRSLSMLYMVTFSNNPPVKRLRTMPG